MPHRLGKEKEKKKRFGGTDRTSVVYTPARRVSVPCLLPPLWRRACFDSARDLREPAEAENTSVATFSFVRLRRSRAQWLPCRETRATFVLLHNMQGLREFCRKREKKAGPRGHFSGFRLPQAFRTHFQSKTKTERKKSKIQFTAMPIPENTKRVRFARTSRDLGQQDDRPAAVRLPDRSSIHHPVPD